MTDHLREAVEVWAPDYPRKVGIYQQDAENEQEALDILKDGTSNGKPGFVSTYSFPRGHSKGGNIPKVDTIFVDFDIRGERYEPDEGRDRKMDWEHEMSDLLVRTRTVAKKLIEEGQDEHWRASLSGHKGVHLFLDFDPIDPANGSFLEFKMGLNEYAESVIGTLNEMCGGISLTKWVDVVSSDLGRLLRMPNTPHPGVEYTDETKYCVPVSIEELAEIDVDRYKELTDEPRSPPPASQRNPSEEASHKITEAISNSEGQFSDGDSSKQYTPSSYDASKIEEYKENSNDKIEIDDLKLLMRDKPFVWEFRERDDAYEHGEESRAMEMFAMLDLIYLYDVPIDVIVDFFRPIPGFDEHYPREMVKDLIARDYSPMAISTLESKAPTFYDGSDIY